MTKIKQDNQYKALATKIRKSVLKMIYESKSSHIGSCFSCIDILAVLYSSTIKTNHKNFTMDSRDRFILSKGHAAAALYALLAELDFFDKNLLTTYNKNDSKLLGHASHFVPGVEISSGSLGHGLGIGCGIALAAKLDNKSNHTYIMISDGECNEGSIWEAALFASHHNLNNLTVIIDYNKIQSYGRVSDVLNLTPLRDKWESFGFNVIEIDGHNYEQIKKALLLNTSSSKKPKAIIAHTVKGKGVSFMEDDLLWHYRPPNQDQYNQALEELETAHAQ